MEFNKEILGKYINIAKNEGPIVRYKYDVTDQILKKFFCIKRNTDRVLGKVLAQFGYTKNDMIYLTDILYKENNIVINYEVNGREEKDNKITIEYSDLIYKYRMVISDKDRDVSCKVYIFGRKNIEFIISEIVEKLDNGGIYSREYSSYSAKYKIVVNNREIELYLGINIRIDDYFDRYILKLEKETELESYLKNIDGTLSLENIYKDIVGYIGDIFKYLDIVLNIKSLDNKFAPVVTDKISVKNGECIQFMVTRGNRCINIDKDGNCISEYKDEDTSVVTAIEDEKATYSISSANQIKLREQAFIHGVNGYEDAINEIDDVKSKILELVPKKK